MTEVNEHTAHFGTVLRVLGEPTRFKICQLLLERHHCSRSISRTLGISESAVSQHMSVLKDAGLVTYFRHGYHVHYVLAIDEFRDMVTQLNGWIERMDAILDCHEYNPCQFRLDDGSDGCLNRSARPKTKPTAKKEKRTMRLAIPSETDEMLESVRSGHFGHTPYFTIVTFDDDKNIVGTEAVKNVDHDQYGCGGVIQFVQTLGVDGILTIGMGTPPLQAFTRSGVTVYSETQTPKVGDVAKLFAEGKVNVMDPSAACRH